MNPNGRAAAYALAEIVYGNERCVLILRAEETWADAAARVPAVLAWIAGLPELPRLDNSYLPGDCVTRGEAAAIAAFRAKQARESGAEVVWPQRSQDSI